MAETRSEVAAMLPMLRQYARTLTGKPALGDHYFRICLELIVENPRRLSSTDSLQSELYRLFHYVWSRANPLEARHRTLLATSAERWRQSGPPAPKFARPRVQVRAVGRTIH